MFRSYFFHYAKSIPNRQGIRAANFSQNTSNEPLHFLEKGIMLAAPAVVVAAVLTGISGRMKLYELSKRHDEDKQKYIRDVAARDEERARRNQALEAILQADDEDEIRPGKP